MCSNVLRVALLYNYSARVALEGITNNLCPILKVIMKIASYYPVITQYVVYVLLVENVAPLGGYWLHYLKPYIRAEQHLIWPGQLEVTWHQYSETGKYHPGQHHQYTCYTRIRTSRQLLYSSRYMDSCCVSTAAQSATCKQSTAAYHTVEWMQAYALFKTELHLCDLSYIPGDV